MEARELHISKQDGGRRSKIPRTFMVPSPFRSGAEHPDLIPNLCSECGIICVGWMCALHEDPDGGDKIDD